MLQVLLKRLETSQISLFAGFSGIGTPELYDARKKVKGEQAVLKVVKTTLLKKAFEKIGIQTASPEFWKGEIMVLATPNGDPIRIAKLLAEWAQQNQKVSIKGGFLLQDKAWLDKRAVEAMSKLLGTKQLQARVVGALAAPIAGLGGVLQALVAQFLGVLAAIEEKQKKSGAEIIPASN